MSNTASITLRRALWLCLPVIWLLLAPAALAQSTIKAGLARSITVLDEPVQFQIKVTNARRESEPPEIAVKDLEIRYLGPRTSSIMRMEQGRIYSEKSIIYIYEITPLKNGVFTIPAVELEVDGRRLKTEPVVLTVQPSTADAAGKPRAQGILEIVVPKTTAYVGEVIPVEVRFFVDARVRWQQSSMPTLPGEGFTKQAFPKPPEPELVPRDGQDYKVLIFKTAITPSRAGKITLEPSEMNYLAQIPRARRSGPKSVFDLFEDEVFGDPAYSGVQQLKVASKSVELTIKPLPVAGRPANFAGAVGDFEMNVGGSPARVKIGDPVTMKLQISGQGNFDRVEAPMLTDPRGWRTYPPSGLFVKEPGDEVGLIGTKTFEMAVIPEEPKSKMPAFSFSYFNPRTEKYVSLSSDPAPLIVEGQKVAPAPSTRATDSASAPGTTPPAAPAPAATDILGVQYGEGPRATFTPLYTQRAFQIAQGVPAAALLLLAGLRLRRPRSEFDSRQSVLRREKAALLSKLRSARLPHAEFFDAAVRLLQVETALATGVDADGVDATQVRAQVGDDLRSAELIDEIFGARAELRFAGVGRGEGEVSGETRSQVLALVQNFGRNHVAR